PRRRRPGRDRAASARPGRGAEAGRAHAPGSGRPRPARRRGGARARARGCARERQHAAAPPRRARGVLHRGRALRRPPRGVGDVRPVTRVARISASRRRRRQPALLRRRPAGSLTSTSERVDHVRARSVRGVRAAPVTMKLARATSAVGHTQSGTAARARVTPPWTTRRACATEGGEGQPPVSSSSGPSPDVARRYGPRVRILLVSQMYPGPTDPDLGVFVAQLERALRERGHELELAVLDHRGGGKRRYLDLRRRVAAAGRPDVVWAHFLVPTGLIAAGVDAPLVVTAHGRDVRNIGAIPGVAALTRKVVRRAAAVIAVSD